jgi:hypothetical protein
MSLEKVTRPAGWLAAPAIAMDKDPSATINAMVSSARIERFMWPSLFRRRQTHRAGVLVAMLCAASMVAALTHAATNRVVLRDVDNRLVDPLQIADGTTAVVVLFISSECPVSNRYAPEIQRLAETFTPRGVRFWLVYPNPADSPEIIRAHVRAFSYPLFPLRDPQHLLVQSTNASVTPEAAVFDARGRLAYRGRIDDRYVRLGTERPAATRHDLEQALTATLAGRPVAPSRTQAVGCFIADFR